MTSKLRADWREGQISNSRERDMRERVGYRNRRRLDQPEASSLVAYSIVGYAFPDKGLNSLAVVAAEVQESD